MLRRSSPADQLCRQSGTYRLICIERSTAPQSIPVQGNLGAIFDHFCVASIHFFRPKFIRVASKAKRILRKMWSHSIFYITVTLKDVDAEVIWQLEPTWRYGRRWRLLVDWGSELDRCARRLLRRWMGRPGDFSACRSEGLRLGEADGRARVVPAGASGGPREAWLRCRAVLPGLAPESRAAGGPRGSELEC